jgi:tripartite-type tricarboxylate transporter receptor subunit TctC
MRFRIETAAVMAMMTHGIVNTCAAADDYPVRPIRLIVPYTPGGSTDPAGRALGQWLSEKFGQPVVVDNRGGAGSTIGHALGAQANPDGYTLLLGTSGGLVVGPAYGTKVPYDPVRDFEPIGLAVDVPFVVAVHPSVTAKTIQDLISRVKAQPDKINFGSPGAGTPNHLGMELLNSLAGTKFVHVPYKGGGLALLDLMSGRIDALFGGLAYVAPAVKSGKVRIIATGHPTRVPSIPDIPAIAEILPGFTNTTWYGLLAPAGTPQPIIRKINTEMNFALSNPEFRKNFDLLGLLAITSTPKELGERIKAELARWTKVIKDAGIGSSSRVSVTFRPIVRK